MSDENGDAVRHSASVRGFKVSGSSSSSHYEKIRSSYPRRISSLHSGPPEVSKAKIPKSVLVAPEKIAAKSSSSQINNNGKQLNFKDIKVPRAVLRSSIKIKNESADMEVGVSPKSLKFQDVYKSESEDSQATEGELIKLSKSEGICSCDALKGKLHLHKFGKNEKTLGMGVPCVRSSSMSDSDFGMSSSRWRCPRRWFACLFMALLFVSIGAMAGVYFAYQFFDLQTPGEKVFRGLFRISNYPWQDDLGDFSSPAHQSTVQEFNERLNAIYNNSVYKTAFIKSEILALDQGQNKTLNVHFNLHIDYNRLHIDAADLYLILMSEIRRPDSRYLDGVLIDENSIILQERRKSISGMYKYSSDDESSSLDGSNFEEIRVAHVGLTNRFTTTTESSTTNPRKCVKLDLTFCATLQHNITTYPNAFGHKNVDDVKKDIITIREVIDSECHPLAFEFLCELLQPDCHLYSQPTPRGTFEDQLILPCKEFCTEVMGSCGPRLPRVLRNAVICDKFPRFQDGVACTAKPDVSSPAVTPDDLTGCVRELRAKGWPDRVCDGVVDCADLTDEEHCTDCEANAFRCGPGVSCVPQTRRCDGVEDCANGADEKGCLSLTPTPTDRSSLMDQRWTSYNREGLLRYTEGGLPSRVCVDNINKTLTTKEAGKLVENVAEVTCALLTYGGIELVEVVTEDVFDHVPGLGYVQISDVHASNITFEPANCSKRTVVYVACKELECGLRPLYIPEESQKTKAAAEGSAPEIDSGDWPWAAALLKDGAHSCDATLVHPLWLLTTSLCFQGQGRALWIARFGTSRISSNPPWMQERLIVGMVKSPVEESQVVLIKLENEIELSDFVRPVCLSSHNQPSQLLARQCRLLGWGARRDPLLQLSVTVTNEKSCNEFGIMAANTLCVQQNSSSDRCLLEEMSGGGLLCEWAERWELAGVAGARSGCSTRPYRIFDEVTLETVKWVKKTIAAFDRNS